MVSIYVWSTGQVSVIGTSHAMWCKLFHDFVYFPHTSLKSCDVFSSAGWAFHISWSKCCLYVWMCDWMLTRVGQIITAAHRDLQSCVHRFTNEPWSHAKNQISLTYFGGQNPTKQPTIGVNKPAECRSPWSACYHLVQWRNLSDCQAIYGSFQLSSVAQHFYLVDSLNNLVFACNLAPHLDPGSCRTGWIRFPGSMAWKAPKPGCSFVKLWWRVKYVFKLYCILWYF